MTRPTVANAEADGNITLENLLSLASVLDESPAYLLCGIEPGVMEQWPTLTTYLYETYGFAAEQIHVLKRSIDAFEAERKLGEIVGHFDDMERRIAERPAAYDREIEPEPEWPPPEGSGDE